MLIGTGPTCMKTALALRLAKALRQRDAAVEVFFFGDGLHNTQTGASVKNIVRDVERLAGMGAALSVCVNMAKNRGIVAANIAGHVKIESLISFSSILTDSDCVVVVNP
jgi:sulfur relay (sulfurtransferase) complex TusBCD TusD component (DsrE family)